MKKRLPTIIILILIIAGLGVLSYPTISTYYNRKFQMNAIEDYNDSVAEMRAEHIAEERKNAEMYNDALTGLDIEDPFIPGSGAVLPDNYTSVLDINNGIMGYIEIPDIDVHLPIYHGTSDEVLEKGVGHMEMTAFPIGGEGNHPVLTGHTGLPGKELFTNLIELEEKNVFYVHILDEVLAYEIDQILVVIPSDTVELKPVEGEDYVTLVTCTPYAVNSHRLMVRGTRIPYSPDKSESAVLEDKEKIPYNLIITAIALIIVISVFIGVLICRKKKKYTKVDDQLK